MNDPYWAHMVQPVMKDESMNAVVAEPIQTGGLVSMIERLAQNPDVDVAKLERLLEMQERIMARQAEAEYAAALAEMQPKLPIITERGEILNKQGDVQSTYAEWEDINEAIRPILAAHGFALTFPPGNDGDKVKTTGVLRHRAGHKEEATFTLPADMSGNKNVVQAAASSLSYCKRYVAIGMLNITTRGEDDDGQKAGGAPTLSREQIANVEALITEVGANKSAFLKWAKVNSLDEILAKNYKAVIQALEDKRKR